MVKIIKVRTLIGLTLVAVSLPSIAKVTSFNVGFVTIQDLNITQTSPLTYGQNVIGTTATTCTITSTFTTPANTGAVVDAQVTDGTTGAGCLTVATNATNNFSGIYVVAGQANQAINVTIGTATGTDFNFSPSGLAVNDTAAYSTATTLFPSTSAAVTLGASGNMNVVVGGTITIGASNLTANTPYSASFNITATY